MTDLALQYLPGTGNDAAKLAARIGIAAHEIALHRFPDGELQVTVGPVSKTSIIYAPLDRPNEKLVALLLAAEALRREGANRLVLVAPYLCYMRQDTAFLPGQAISQRVIGRLLADTVDRVICVDAHLHRTADIHAVFPGIESDNLSAAPAIAYAMRSAGYDPATIIVGPDAESLPWVSALASPLGLEYAVASKVRRDDRFVDMSFSNIEMFAGRPALIVDDIVSSGGTLVTCAKALAAAGAHTIDVVVVHALFNEDLQDQLSRVGIRSIRSTSSVPHPTNAIALDGILADALVGEWRGPNS